MFCDNIRNYIKYDLKRIHCKNYFQNYKEREIKQTAKTQNKLR